MYQRGSVLADLMTDWLLGPKEDCPECDGTGKVTYESGSYPCDGCNGTGIKGNPRKGFKLALLVGVLFWIGVALLYRKMSG